MHLKRGVNKLQFLPRATFCALALFLFSACAVPPPQANGWAIVAADPATGKVGVAAASCSEYPLDYRAVLVPDKGAGVLLGVNSPLLRDRFSAWIQEPRDANTILREIIAPSNDPDPSQRLYGFVTIRDGKAKTGSYIGRDIAIQANHTDDSSQGVAILASGMTDSSAVSQILRVYADAASAHQSLHVRLMRALEAGSAAGGIALCNQNGVTQTASTAFLMFANRSDPVFQVQTLGNTASQEPTPPFLAVSVTEPIGGRNAVKLLRDQYNSWRAKYMLPCPACETPVVTVPPGNLNPIAPPSFLTQHAVQIVAGFVLLVMLLTILFFALRPHPEHTHTTSP